jgi:hypothetical protein
MNRRQRGVVLTDRGKQRLEAAIASARDQEKYGARFTQMELEDRAGLSIKTIKKIRHQEGPADQSRVEGLFSAFNLTLEPADYGWPQPDADAPLQPGFDVAAYRRCLQANYGYLKLYTLDSTDRADNIKLWSMFIEQTVREALPPSRYELPLDLKRQLQDEDALGEDLSAEALDYYRREYFQQPARKVLAAVAESQRSVVLGDPGAGKSTLLQYLGLEWVENDAADLPLLIELREYALAGSANFLEFLHRGRGVDWQFDPTMLHDYLTQHPTLVMFDGLDEVFDRATQATIIDDIIRFAQQYPLTKILVTSRIIGYNPERLQHAEFRHFTIQPLDDGEVNEFIERWYDLAMGTDADKVRLKQRLREAIASSKAIQNLADNPLLLTMMAILNRRQELPRDRADLYDQASRVLLYHWDVDHKRLQLPMDAIGRREKQEILRLVAYEMQAGEDGLKGNLISANRLTQILTDYLREQGFSEPREKANGLIHQLRHRNFILCDRGADTYGFVHRTFLEYFCAVEIVNRFEKQRTLSFEQLRDEVFGRHWSDRNWHEVLRLTCGMLGEGIAKEIIETLLKEKGKEEEFLNLILAAGCISEINKSAKTKLLSKSILRTLLSESQKIASPRVRNSRLYRNLIFAIKDLELGWEEIREDLEIHLENRHPDSGFLEEPLPVLISQEFSQNSEAFNWLENLFYSGKNRITKLTALQGIARFKKDSDILIILKDWLVNQDDQWDKSVASNMIGKFFGGDPETFSWLKKIAMTSDCAYTKSFCLRTLADNWKDEPEVLTLLHYQIHEEKNQEARGLALEVLAHSYFENPDTLSTLIFWLKNSENSRLKASVIHAMADSFMGDAEIVLLLKNEIEKRDSNKYVRAAVLGSLVKKFFEDPDFLSWAKNIFSNEESEWVRKKVARCLGLYANNNKSNLAALEWLMDIAKNDNSPKVRSFSIALLADIWGYKDEVLEFIKERMNDDKNGSVQRTCILHLNFEDFSEN